MTDAERIAALRQSLSGYLRAVPDSALRSAIASNWVTLGAKVAERLCREKNFLSLSWDKAVQLERACFAAAHRRLSVLKGVVISNDPDFRLEYASLVYRVAGALEERIPLVSQVAAPPEVLAPAAAGPFAEAAAERQQTKVAYKESATEKCRRPGCGSKKILVKSFQTRSTDEAPTITNHCQDCGHIWRS